MQSNKIYPLADCPESHPLSMPHELLSTLPSSQSQQNFVAESRQAVERILNGQDKRLLLIVGPCSIHDTESAVDYASRLKALSEEIAEAFFVVMRVYLEKPRTVLGWKGFAFDPYLDGSYEINKGLFLSRKLLLQLADLKLPAATEFLDQVTGHYFGDLITWGCIGARTAESQLHRQMASGLPMPIAFKNNTNGNVEVAVNGILTASHSHTFMSTNKDGLLAVVTTQGNAQAHLVLRGGAGKPNFDHKSVARAIFLLKEAKQPASLLIDCSHDNSQRLAEKQPAVFQSVLQQYLRGNNYIKGMCLESHIHFGNQPFLSAERPLKYGISITDPCLDWERTESLLKWGYSQLKSACLVLIMCMMMISCSSPEILTAFTEYVTREDLASYKVGTPDPYLNCPSVGQRLYVSWRLPKDFQFDNLNLQMTMRFRDSSQISQTVSLYEPLGTYVYNLLDEEYEKHQGFLTYKIELWADGLLLKEWRHQMWVELISFGDENKS